MQQSITVGLISDTHGLLRPEAITALAGSDFIIHAGDVGDPAIIEALAYIAPVTAVRGNVDPVTLALPATETLNVGNVRIYVIHNISELNINPAKTGCQVVVYGHSHKPSVADENGVLFVNPGSAGPRRFKLPICIGRLVVENGSLSAALIELAP